MKRDIEKWKKMSIIKSNMSNLYSHKFNMFKQFNHKYSMYSSHNMYSNLPTHYQTHSKNQLIIQLNMSNLQENHMFNKKFLNQEFLQEFLKFKNLYQELQYKEKDMNQSQNKSLYTNLSPRQNT